MTALLLALMACAGGSTANVQNPTSPQPPAVSIALQSPATQSILVNGSAQLNALVENDDSNAGVDWTITCAAGSSCGKLTPLHTASGDSTTYSPPSALSGNSESVSIVAFATADRTQNVTSSVTITGFAPALKGNYVFQAQGADATLNPYQIAGVVALDGNGNVTGGEQTVNFYDENEDVNTLVSRADPVTGGTYFVGADGRGLLTVRTNDADVGQNGIESFSFVLLSSSHLLVAEMDTLETATGTMDLQTSTTAPTGGYAFVVNGMDIPSYSPAAIGGIINIDSPGTISGAGSIADQNLYGYMTQNQKLSGTVSAADSLGAVTINLTIPGFTSATVFQFTGYIVDDTHLILAESDNNSGAGSGSSGGIAIAQGSSAGTFKDPSAFNGTFVFGVSGMDLTGFTPDTLTSVGVLTADGAGNLSSGFTDTFFQQNYNQPPNYLGAQISSSFGGTYTMDKAGVGRVRVALKGFTPPVHPSITQSYIFYLTGNGNPPLILAAGDTTFNYPSVGAGIAYSRASQLGFSGDYGFNTFQENGLENNGTGQFTANSAAGTLAGVADMNLGFTAAFTNAFNDTFQPPDVNGRIVGTLFNSSIAVVYYPIDAAHGFFVETDLVSPGTDQVSFGCYAARTPVCEGCQ